MGGFAVVRATSALSSASSYVPVSPVRVLDTRSNPGLVAVTAVNPTLNGYVSLRPGDATGAPTVSTLIVTAGGTFPNGATITVPKTGSHAGEIQVWYEAEGTTVGSTGCA